MQNNTLNIVELIKNNPITRLSSTYQSKLLNKIKDKMNTEEQRIFVASFFYYLNYSKNDFVIDLDHIWEWLGYNRKNDAKKILAKHFAEPEDYKIVKIADKLYEENFAEEVTVAKKGPKSTINLETRGGFNKEQILMTIKTFKKLCLKANTNKSNQIHDYYLNLEEILNETINEESDELRLQLEENKNKLEENKQELANTCKDLKKERTLRNKMLRRNYFESKPGHTVYLYEDKEYDIIEEEELTVLKVGKSTNIGEREKIYAGLSKNGKMLYVQYTHNCNITEKVIQHLLDRYRPNKMTEWFRGVSAEIAIDTIKTAILFLDGQLKDIDTLIPQTKNYLMEITGLTGEENEQAVNTVKKEIKVELVDKEDYKMFIKECCELKEDKNYNCPKQDFKNAYKIWSKKNIITEAEKYFNETFRETTMGFGNISRLVFKNVRLLPLTFKPKDATNLKDYEEFIIGKCKVNYQYRTSFIDFFKYFIEYKQESNINYKLSYKYKQDIQTFLENAFFKARVYLSNVTSTKHLTGVYGLGIEANNFGSNIRNRNNKSVFQFNSETGLLSKSWDSLTLASKELGISKSTLCDYISYKRIKKNFTYKYTEYEIKEEK